LTLRTFANLKREDPATPPLKDCFYHGARRLRKRLTANQLSPESPAPHSSRPVVNLLFLARLMPGKRA
jgi:hypothetical protein